MSILNKYLPIIAIGLFLSTVVHADNSARNKEIADRFASCDKNHDGKLTKEEAKGCMPRIYDHFSFIDSDGKGYVTVAQIQALASR
jgi:Ca2+-binding EF-hand superfamily protein